MWIIGILQCFPAWRRMLFNYATFWIFKLTDKNWCGNLTEIMEEISEDRIHVYALLKKKKKEEISVKYWQQPFCLPESTFKAP